jgi:16S rRNA (uracil1498-N3)-methyltransferase
MMRLYVPRLVPGGLLVAGADHHYLAHVLRVRPGDEVVVFDGRGGSARARVDAVTADAVSLAVGDIERTPAPRVDLALLVALLKGEKMDLVVQKATELGAARIVPLRAERSVVKLEPSRAGARIARWQKIANEAARQCGRADAPAIAAPAAPAEAFAAASGFRVAFHERAVTPLRRVLPEAPPERVAIAIGPEGGFTDAEIDSAAAAGFAVCGLGPRVLRAETAAIAALAAVAFSVGDFA